MRLLALFTLAALMAGCSLGGDDDTGGSIEESQLGTLVLQPSDLSREFLQFDEGPQGIADSPGGNRSDARRFGRVQGWKARYRRQGSPQTRGPLVIESRADLFESSEGAADELEAIEEDATFDEIDAPEIGDDARAFESGTGEGVSYFLIAWRKANVTSSLLVSGFEGKITLDDALALARKQASHASRAAGR